MTIGPADDYNIYGRRWDEDDIPAWTEIEWERGELLDFDAEERQEDCVVTAERDGVKYEGVGTYSCGNLILVDDIEITKTCPNCKGERAVAHRCTCGTIPINSAYSRCESCYRAVDWRSCPLCGGKGTIKIK